MGTRTSTVRDRHPLLLHRVGERPATAAEHDHVSPGGGVDTLVLPTIDGSIQLVARAVKGLNFNADMFPKQLEARGLAGDVLGNYPYRDDGLLVWQAMARF